MPRKKKTSKINFKEDLEIPRRDFYIKDKLEFSLFFDASVVDKDVIMQTFLDSNVWKSHASIFEWKYVSAKFSEDLSRVDIKVRGTTKTRTKTT